MTTPAAQEKGRLGKAAGHDHEGVSHDRNTRSANSSPSSSTIILAAKRVLHHGGPLSADARWIYVVLSDFMYGGKVKAFPSVLTLASLAGLPERSARRAMRELRIKGFIQAEGKGGRGVSNRYTLLTGDGSCEGGSRCACERPKKPGHIGRVSDEELGHAGRDTLPEAHANPAKRAAETLPNVQPKPCHPGRGNVQQRNVQKKKRACEADSAGSLTARDAPETNSTTTPAPAPSSTETKAPKTTATNADERAKRYVSAFNAANGKRETVTPMILKCIGAALTAKPPYVADALVASAIMSCSDEWYSDREPSYPLRFRRDGTEGKSHLDDLLAKIAPGQKYGPRIVELVKQFECVDYFKERTLNHAPGSLVRTTHTGNS